MSELEITLKLRVEATSANIATAMKMLREMERSAISQSCVATQLPDRALDSPFPASQVPSGKAPIEAENVLSALFEKFDSDSVQSRASSSDVSLPSEPQRSQEATQASIGSLIARSPGGRLDLFTERGIPTPEARGKSIGSWVQFNSFFPVIATCRLASNVRIAGEVEPLPLDRFVKTIMGQISFKKLNSARGFPSSSKPTAVGRLVWHFMITGHEMGLLNIASVSGEPLLPMSLSDWDRFTVTVTRSGYELAELPNRFLDEQGRDQVLDAEVATWLVGYLRAIDAVGYREYIFLRDILNYLKQGHDGRNDLRQWIENDLRFKQYVASWSRKVGLSTPDEGQAQLTNLASTCASSKVALLRELRLVDPHRGHYEVVGDLE